jgi:hypothetical protein
MSKNKDYQPNEETEMWKQIHRKQQATKKIIREDRTKSIYAHIIDLEEAGIEVFKLTSYQYRFIQGEHRIDYYPTSGKYFDINLKKWGNIPAFKLITLFTN